MSFGFHKAIGFGVRRLPAAVPELARSVITRMNTKPVIYALLLTGFITMRDQSLAQEKARHILPDDPTKAWAEVQKVHQALRPPDDRRAHEPTPEQVAESQKRGRQTAVSFADKAREFRRCGWWTSAAICGTRTPALILSGALLRCLASKPPHQMNEDEFLNYWPNRADAANRAMASWLPIEDQWRRVAGLDR